MKRVFDIDITLCPLCGGQLRVIADVTDPGLIRKILDHVIGTGHTVTWAIGLLAARNHLREVLGEECFTACVATGAAMEFPAAAVRCAREQIARCLDHGATW